MCSCIAAFLYVVVPALLLLGAPWVLHAYDATLESYKALSEALSASNSPVAWRYSVLLADVYVQCVAAVMRPAVYRIAYAISVALCITMCASYLPTGPPMYGGVCLDRIRGG